MTDSVEVSETDSRSARSRMQAGQQAEHTETALYTVRSAGAARSGIGLTPSSTINRSSPTLIPAPAALW